MSSKTRQLHPISSGRRTLPISRSSAGAGSTSVTILDDYSRYVIAWKLCTTMKASDVTDTLELALQASGCDQVNVRHRPRIAVRQWSSYIATELAEWLDDKGNGSRSRRSLPSPDPGQDRTMAPDPEEPHPVGKLLPPRRSEGPDRQVHQPLQSPTIP